jgi:hypothetical protein
MTGEAQCDPKPWFFIVLPAKPMSPMVASILQHGAILGGEARNSARQIVYLYYRK